MIVLLLVAGLALLYVGANLLTDGAAAMAARLHLSEFVIGATVVAVGTSMPELVVSVMSAVEGKSDVAIGNVIGSNIFNTLFILGITALVAPLPVSRKVLRGDVRFALLVSLLLTVLLFSAALGLGGADRLSRVEGCVLLVLFAVYVVVTIRRSDRTESGTTQHTQRWWIMAVMIVAGVGALVWGGHLFLNGSIRVARMLGISESAIALILVAGGTSLPELATTFFSALRGRTEVALGNIVGSNIANILLILGISATITPLGAGGVNITDALVMSFAQIALLVAVAVVTPRRLSRVAGVLFLLLYVAYTFTVVRAG